MNLVDILQVDKGGKGSISLSDYFSIFSSHGIVVDRVERARVVRLAGEGGTLSKDKFVKIVQGSDFFMKSFDKNKDGEVTEVNIWQNIGAKDHFLTWYLKQLDIVKIPWILMA